MINLSDQLTSNLSTRLTYINRQTNLTPHRRNLLVSEKAAILNELHYRSLSSIVTSRLLRRVAILNSIKARGTIIGQPITQQGLDWINGELSAIDAILTDRAPTCDFTDLIDGFEPAVYLKLELAQDEIVEVDSFNSAEYYGLELVA